MAATMCFLPVRAPFSQYTLFLRASQRCTLCRRHISATQIVLRKREKINPLEKFMKKAGKKFYYDVPQLPKQTGVEVPIKQKVHHTESIRQRVVNNTLKKHITDLVQSCQVSQELEDAQVEITKVSVTPDFLTARVYWKAPGFEDDKHIEDLLDRSRFELRHALIQLHVIGKVPPIVFIKDKEQAAIDEVERLLASADFGPEEEQTSENLESDKESDLEESLEELTLRDNLIDRMPLFNIDHHSLNKHIMQNRARAIKWDSMAEDGADIPEIMYRKRNKKKLGRAYEDPDTVLRDMQEETDSESEISWENSGYESDEDESSSEKKK
ncbi:RBFA [Branchiostoma lanceolatum]|uniref:RBFA protein n=1 Tax=Branchiostoma lanceolatum TaxID=7740 RepID=A0A8K0A6E0_BRALA|nr:RBFA [Branchiostoma lanceolatum]